MYLSKLNILYITMTTETPDDKALSQFINEEARKKGISSKEAKKAFKKLKSGGMMAQVAPQLHAQFMEMNPNLTARDKLRMKRQKMREGRSNKASKERSYERSRQEMQERQQREKEEREQKKQQDIQKARNYRKRLKELEKKIGQVSQELYNKCMDNIQLDNYTDDGERNRDRKIVDLYAQQQQFKEQIDMDDLDNI